MADIADLLDPAKLREITDQMVDAISSPAYVDAMRAIKAAPEENRLEEAMRLLTPEALIAQGVPLPPGMRISSRYFEAGFDSIEVGEFLDGQPNILRALNERDPTLLDRLRTRDPLSFNRFVRLVQPNRFSPDPLALCGCGGGGAATICGCAGGG
jgi:hypothetical protein